VKIYPQLRDLSQFQASALALIAANLLPVFGVLFLGWDTFPIVALYWIENVIIGAINVLKMLTCSPDAERLVLGDVDSDDTLNRARMERSRGDAVTALRLAHHGSKLFFIPFFTVHYGLFCLVHGVFVFSVFGREAGGFGPFGGFDNAVRVFGEEHLWWGVAALAASHLWSFFVNYLGRGEYRRTAVPLLMGQPYARVVVLHLAILFGAFVTLALGSNAGVLLILIAGKTILDLSLHIREHERAEQSASSIMPQVLTDGAEELSPTPLKSER
jgi:hypothetical protein